jgi:ABC-2 type transport system permease protein
MLFTEIRKWRKTISVILSKEMAYKLDFLLSIFVPALVFMLISYNVWGSIYDHQPQKSIGGYSKHEMLQYQAWAFITALLVRSHRSWNLSDDIRLGRITSFLLYPFSFWKFHSCEFIGFQGIQLIIAALSLTVLLLCGVIEIPTLHTLLLGVAFCMAIGVLWFALEFLFGLAAFWLEETWVFRYIFQIFAVVLSGGFFPLELFPQWLQKALAFTPFPFMTAFPVQIFLGRQHGDLLGALALIVTWLGIVIVITRLAWRRGIRLYTAAGM